MKSKGHDVFIDVNSITIGDPWARSIEKNISDCDMFVVILTPDALSSSLCKTRGFTGAETKQDNCTVHP